eukprot:1152469-Pleurochrysis_carterae.AAC.1
MDMCFAVNSSNAMVSFMHIIRNRHKCEPACSAYIVAKRYEDGGTGMYGFNSSILLFNVDISVLLATNSTTRNHNAVL